MRAWRQGNEPGRFHGLGRDDKKASGNLQFEASQLGGLEIGRDEVRPLKESRQGCGNFSGQTEPDVNCALKFQFQSLVINADCDLERADEVTDHIFRGVMKQSHETCIAAEPGIEVRRNPFHQHAMLRDRKAVLALGLAIPARHARQAMGDVLNLDVQR